MEKSKKLARDLLPLKAEPVGSGRIDVSWTDNGNLPLYLSYKYSQGKQWDLIEIPAGENSFAFVGLDPGGQYEFQLFSTGRAVSEKVTAVVGEENDSSMS